METEPKVGDKIKVGGHISGVIIEVAEVEVMTPDGKSRPDKMYIANIEGRGRSILPRFMFVVVE